MNSKKPGALYLQVYIGTGLALTVLLTVVILGYKSFSDTRSSADWVAHTFSVISKSQRVQTEVSELGISQRGFIMTSQQRHLNYYQSVIPTLDQELRDLNELTRDNEIQQKRIAELKLLIQNLKQRYAIHLEYVKNKKVNLAIESVKSGVGQDTLDEIHERIHEIIGHEEMLLKERLKIQKTSSRNSNFLILLGSILSFLFVFIASMFVVREFKRRAKIQEDLNRNSEVQKAILNSAAFALVASNTDGTITLFNPAAEKLLGYTPEEMIGKTPDHFHLPEEVTAMSKKLSERFSENIPAGYETFVYRARHGIVESDNWTYVRKDGKHIPVSLSVTAQKDQYGEITGFLGIAYDISQQLAYEKAILKAKEQAVAGTQAKSEFLANMSHEIRTPMNAIMGMAELLSESDLNEEQKKYVEVFTRAGESLLNLINDILDLSKIEAGHFELDLTPFSLSTIVDKSSEIIALKAHQKHLELAIDIEENLHDYYIGDGNRIRQILLNLLGNAIKFTKKGEVLLRIYSGKNVNHLKEIFFEVQDTGIGMNEEQLKNLFERFNQADSSITKEYGGTGLGLNITKRLVELMTGKIEVESEFGRGSKFTAKILLKEDEIPAKEVEKISLLNKKILVVDDTKTNRFILKKMLEYQGALTEEALDGESAIEKIKSATILGSPYDLILLDCRMPGIDGFKVAEQVQGSELKGPLIMMLTSDNRPGDLAKSKSLGLKSYLVKPVLKNELLHEISKAMLRIEASTPKVQVDQSFHPDLKILLVDDNDENRLVIRSFVKRLPWKFDEAKNGKEALDLFSPGKYDIILMDMQMPVLDGYSATREIRKIEKELACHPTPILALTAYALKEEVDKSLKAGCNGHLSKPIAKAALIKSVEDSTHEILVVIEKDLEDLIPDYLAKRSSEVVELLSALENNNFPQIQATGHKLRGSAGSYGFNELSEIGKELEEKSKVCDATSITHALTQYQHYLKRVKVSFS
jgi:PAS domain S-box-containing protein